MRSFLLAILTSCFFLPAFTQINLNKGLIAYYPMNGNSNDVSGNNNNSVYNSATLTTDRFGNANSAYYFDGIDDYISIPGSTTLNSPTSMSVALYFNPAQTTVQNLVGKINYIQGDGTQFQVAINFSLYPGVLFAVYNPADNCANKIALNSSYVNSGGRPVALNQWYCVVSTFDNGIQKIYLNGTLISTTNATFTTLKQCASSDIQIGTWWKDDKLMYKGKIDDIRVYNRALTTDEVAALCTACSNPTTDFHFSQDVCNPLSVQFFTDGSGFTNPVYDFGDGSTSTGVLSPVHTYTIPADYTIGFSVQRGSCKDYISKTIAVKTVASDIVLTPDTSICSGSTATLRAKPGLTYCWSPATFLNDPRSATPITSTLQDITYYCTAQITDNNLILNGDFSNGRTGITSDYAYTTNGIPTAVYGINSNPQAWHPAMPACKDHTTGTGNMMLVNGADVANVKVWSQTVNVTPNTNYAFSTWLMHITTLSPAILQFSINGVPIGNNFKANNISCIWDRFYAVWNSGNNTKATISILNQNTDLSGNDFALDDIEFAELKILRDSVKIVVMPPPTHTPIQAINLCTGDMIKIGTGVKNAQYTWNTGATTDSITVNTAGTYWVQTDRYGCTNKDSMIVTEIALPVVDLGPNDQRCVMSNLVLDAGNAGATFLWHDGTTAQTFTANDFGKYYVRVTNTKGCVNADTITISKILKVPADFYYKQDICNPLTVQFYGAGNNLLNAYWSFGDGNTATGTLMATNTYPSYGSRIVKFGFESNTCKDTITKVITIDVTNSNLVLTSDTTICFNTTKQLRTQPGLSFCWSPGTYLDDPNSPNPVTSTPVKMTYYYTSEVTGANLVVNGDFDNGNTGFSSQYAYVPKNITEGEYFVTADPPAWNSLLGDCHDHTTGNGNMLLVSGAPVANVEVWTQTIPITPNTNYAFTAWLQNANVNHTGSNPPRLQFSINGIGMGNVFQGSNAVCNWDRFYAVWNSGNNTTATISIVNQNTVVDGNDFGLDDISFAPVFIHRDSVIISVDSPVVRTNNDTTICKDGRVQLQATGAMTWSWAPAAGLTNANISNPVATPAMNTDYEITGTTSNGCVAKDTVAVKLFPIPTILPIHDTLVCPDKPVQLTANNAMVTYAWSPAATLNNPAIADPMAMPVKSTEYKVQVQDVNHCSYIDSMTVRIRTFRFSAGLPAAICQGSSIKLRSGGGDRYLWSPAASLDDATAGDPTATPDTTTIYHVNIAENNCGADTTINIRVTVNPTPVVKAEKVNDIDCVTHSTKLKAAGSAGSSYRWAPASGLDYPTLPDPVSSADSTTKYFITATNQHGCAAIDSVTVYVTAAKKVSFEVPNAFTPNGDGLNDCLGLKSWGGATIDEFSIFNRWGERVFTTNKPGVCWDGRFRGEIMPTGGYTYIIKAKTWCGSIKRSGVVMLIR